MANPPLAKPAPGNVPMANEELEFANDPAGAIETGGASTGWRVLLTIAALIAAGVLWADRAEVEQVTTGQGKVIPSSQVQTT